jgi:2,6-dihydroxypseudooxynicotine hydrolase
MTEQDVSYLWENIFHRFLAEGAIYRELQDLKRTIRSYDGWRSAWVALARETEERAEQSLRSSSTQTAAEDFQRSSIYYFFAQFLLWDDADGKRQTYQDCARVFRSASAHLTVPQDPIQIPYRDIQMPGFMRLPLGVNKPPCVLLINGLDTTKEEQLMISNLCIQRGLATVSFDGPGQGETFYRMKMNAHYVEAVYAALDFIEARPEIDCQRIGIIGRSLGSHYAARAAMSDSRIKAVASWGSMFDLRNFRTIPPLTLAGFKYVTGSQTLDDAIPYLESVDLSQVEGRINCPLMVLNGGRDPITPPANIERMKALGDGAVEVLFWEDGSHCAHDRPHISRPALADFMHRHLANN